VNTVFEQLFFPRKLGAFTRWKTLQVHRRALDLSWMTYDSEGAESRCRPDADIG